MNEFKVNKCLCGSCRGSLKTNSVLLFLYYERHTNTLQFLLSPFKTVEVNERTPFHPHKRLEDHTCGTFKINNLFCYFILHEQSYNM